MDKNRCEYVELNFLLSGHTKFSPDRLFGVFKGKYAVTNIDCFSDILQCVISSSRNGYNVPVPIRFPNSLEPQVEWKSFDTYFKSLYGTLKGILQFHHFIFKSKLPVMCKHFVNSEVEHVSITLKESLVPDLETNSIEIISPSGLSVERQWYLFKQIRGLCIDSSKMDEVAPKPTIPEKSKNAEVVLDSYNLLDAAGDNLKKKKRTLKAKKNKGEMKLTLKKKKGQNRTSSVKNKKKVDKKLTAKKRKTDQNLTSSVKEKKKDDRKSTAKKRKVDQNSTSSVKNKKKDDRKASAKSEKHNDNLSVKKVKKAESKTFEKKIRTKIRKSS